MLFSSVLLYKHILQGRAETQIHAGHSPRRPGSILGYTTGPGSIHISEERNSQLQWCQNLKARVNMIGVLQTERLQSSDSCLSENVS